MRASVLFAVPALAASFLACGSNANPDDSSTTSSNPSVPAASSSSGNAVTPSNTTSASSSSSGNGYTALPTGSSTSSGSVAVDSGTPAPAPEVNFTTQSMTYNGLTRSYIIGVPVDYNASKSYPVVMLFHGNPGSKEQMRQFAPFEQVSHKDAILVYPDASNGAWDLYTPTASNLDMNWINSLPATIASSYNIDLSHVYGFGFSGGAFMMVQMACRFGTQVFRAVSINSGGGPQEGQMGFPTRSDGCYICPGGPVPSLIVHGDSDTTVSPESGKFTARCISETNGCTATASALPEDPTTPSPCTKGDGCSDPTTWCYIPGMNHAVWEHAMDAGWAFFQAAP